MVSVGGGVYALWVGVWCCRILQQYTSSQKDSRERWEGEGKRCGKMEMCILDGNVVCGVWNISTLLPQIKQRFSLERLSFQAECSWPQLCCIYVQ